MGEILVKTRAMPADDRVTCCVEANEENLEYCSPCIGANEENLEYCSPCIGANEENLDHSSPGRLAWYFAQPSIPGLIHLATINGYVASGPYKTKGGKDDV
ncbi:MAG: hypothetical protein JSW22_06145 [Chloroflexota bacterium]|nr:MAG: hypothetical protein JSW22_06145 [Chloroflexota bacterium]